MKHCMLAKRLAFVLCLGAMVLWAAQLPGKRVWAGHNDFMQLYAGGTLAGTPELYSSDANRALDQRLGFWMPSVQYVRPPFYAALLKPLAMLPYRTAYFLFQCACIAAALGFAFLGRRRNRALPWLMLISIPLLTAFANGQDVVIVLALCAAGLFLDKTGKPWLAGLCLALCAIKFHLFVFTPLALLLHRKWRFAASAALGVAVEVAISFAVAGSAWPFEYAKFLQNPVLHPRNYLPPNLSSIAGENAALGVVLTIVVAVVTILTCWRAKSFAAAFVICVFAGLLVVPHSYIQDCVLLLLVPVFIEPASNLLRQLGNVLATPFPYFLLMADGPVGLITPLLLLVWFFSLAANACSKNGLVFGGSFFQRIDHHPVHRGLP